MWQARQWVRSVSEPELGLGRIVQVELSRCIIEVFFEVSKETRFYSQKNAPLQRMLLSAGESFLTEDGSARTVEKSEEFDGYFFYLASGRKYPEYEISAVVPDEKGLADRFISGCWSHYRSYDLRRQALKIRGAAQATPVRGLVGARVLPLPHQLYIAAEVSRRPFPRVLLADEVGLGKTIEAGLIYSALKSLGRADKVLIIAPESLVHQWMAELFRRFGDMFCVLNAERCSEEESSQGVSGFRAAQKLLVSVEFLLKDELRRHQALEESWDLIIIDEAHHLDWDDESPDARWLLAEAFSKVCWSLLLLTATPGQRGLATQFGLLKLVDPDRYSDFDVFFEESCGMKAAADLAKEILAADDLKTLRELKIKMQCMFPDDPFLLKNVTDGDAEGTEKVRKIMLDELVDRHGTGRVLFRNRRERLRGFPKRVLRDVPLEPGAAWICHLKDLDSSGLTDLSLMDIATGRGYKRTWAERPAENPRYCWLLNHIRTEPREKALVLCASGRRASELANFLEESLPGETLVFHEGLSMVERDRQAARFAEPGGPLLLICSEIGGEGRNFQFVKKLILMDIPRLPDLLEQRIGRIDRIGQGSHIEIWVPWLKDTSEEVLLNWYHRGLGSFESFWNGADSLLEYFAEDLLWLFRAFFPDHPEYERRYSHLENLIKRTQKKVSEFRAERAESVDILLDQNSFVPHKGLALKEMVEDCDDDPSVELFMRNMFDHYGVEYEELDDRGSLIVRPESLMFIDYFPGLGDQKDTMMTFDRSVALAREDISFVTQDHPLTESCLSLLLDRNEGVASLCRWPRSGRGRGVLLDVSVVFRATGPGRLELDKYLPVSSMEYTLDQNASLVTDPAYRENHDLLAELNAETLPLHPEQLKRLLTPLLERVLKISRQWTDPLREKAISAASEEFGMESERILYLSQISPSVSGKDVQYIEEQRDAVLECLKKSVAEIDGVRLIFTE